MFPWSEEQTINDVVANKRTERQRGDDEEEKADEFDVASTPTMLAADSVAVEEDLMAVAAS